MGLKVEGLSAYLHFGLVISDQDGEGFRVSGLLQAKRRKNLRCFLAWRAADLRNVYPKTLTWAVRVTTRTSSPPDLTVSKMKPSLLKPQTLGP